MKAMKLTILVLLLFGLSNCKVKFSEDGEIVIIDNEKFYTGDVEEISYQLNNDSLERPMKSASSPELITPPPYFSSLSFNLKLNRKGKVKGELIDSQCRVEKDVDVELYAKLADRIENADVVHEVTPMPAQPLEVSSDIDGSSPVIYPYPGIMREFLDLTYDDGDQERTYLAGGSPRVYGQDYLEIKKLVEEIIQDLRKGCEVGTPIQYAVIWLKWDQNINEFEPNDGPKSTTTRRFSFEQDGKGYRVSGLEHYKHHRSALSCNRHLDKVRLPKRIADLMQTIDVRQSEMVCDRAPWGGSLLTMSFEKDGQQKKGTAGCFNQSQLIKYNDFRAAFENWLNSQTQVCTRMGQIPN